VIERLMSLGGACNLAVDIIVVFNSFMTVRWVCPSKQDRVLQRRGFPSSVWR
jgi:hypothetical protein